MNITSTILGHARLSGALSLALVGAVGLFGGEAAAQTQPEVRQVEAGPIWSDANAREVCPRVCVAPTRWNGQWRTTVPGRMSTCDCELPPPVVRQVEAGPIWSDTNAREVCPRVCASPSRWNGQWRTTVPGRMSTCDCETPYQFTPAAPPAPPAPEPTPPTQPAVTVRQVEAGPIWNTANARRVCPRVCPPPSRWNGQWRTTVPGRMSTCDCETPAQ